MSLMRSLTKVAAGVMLAKGIGTMMNNQHGGRPGQRKASGGLLDNLLGNNTGGTSGGSLNQMLGRALGGGTGTGSGFGLAACWTSWAASAAAAALGSGAGAEMLGGLLGGAAAGSAAGHLATKGSQEKNNATFGALFDDALAHDGEPQVAPTPEQNAIAGLMLRAMIQAAKSDGHVDNTERQRLLGHLGDDLDDDERQFIRDQMAAPVDAAGAGHESPKAWASGLSDVAAGDRLRQRGRGPLSK